MTDPQPISDREKAAKVLRGAGDRARAGIEQARQKAGDVISTTREKGEAVIEDTREKTFRAAAETNRMFQEHPITAVAAAAAAGAVLGIFLPRFIVASRASKLAQSAVKAAATTEVAQAILSSVREGGKASRTEAKSLLAPVAAETSELEDDMNNDA